MFQNIFNEAAIKELAGILAEQEAKRTAKEVLKEMDIKSIGLSEKLKDGINKVLVDYQGGPSVEEISKNKEVGKMIDKIKAKYHEKFRKNIKHDKPYFEQLLERAWSEMDKHPAFNPYIKDDKKILQYREELKALNELIKLYQLQIDIKAEKPCCTQG